MKNFEYYAPTKVFFGRGQEEKIGEIIKSYGYKKVLLHYGKGSVIKSGLLDIVKNRLSENGISYVELGGVEPNPKLPLVREGAALVKKENIDFTVLSKVSDMKKLCEKDRAVFENLPGDWH